MEQRMSFDVDNRGAVTITEPMLPSRAHGKWASEREGGSFVSCCLYAVKGVHTIPNLNAL